MDINEAQQIESIVNKSVTQTLVKLGFRLDEDDAINNMQEDMAYLRRLRRGSDSAKGIVLASCLTTAVSTFLYLLYKGLTSFPHNFNP